MQENPYNPRTQTNLCVANKYQASAPHDPSASLQAYGAARNYEETKGDSLQSLHPNQKYSASETKQEKSFLFDRGVTDIPINITATNCIRCMTCDVMVPCADMESHIHAAHGGVITDIDPEAKDHLLSNAFRCCYQDDTQTILHKPGQIPIATVLNRRELEDNLWNEPPRIHFALEAEKEFMPDEVSYGYANRNIESPQECRPLYQQRIVESVTYVNKQKKPMRYEKATAIWDIAPEPVKGGGYLLPATQSAKPQIFQFQAFVSQKVLNMESTSKQTGPKARPTQMSELPIEQVGEIATPPKTVSAPTPAEIKAEPHKIPVVFVPRTTVQQFQQTESTCTSCGAGGGCSCSVECCGQSPGVAIPAYPASPVAHLASPDIRASNRVGQSHYRVRSPGIGSQDNDQLGSVPKQVIEGRQHFVMSEEEISLRRSKLAASRNEPVFTTEQVSGNCFSCHVSCCSAAPAGASYLGGTRMMARSKQSMRVRYVPMVVNYPVYEMEEEEENLVPISLKQYEQHRSKFSYAVTPDDGEIVIQPLVEQEEFELHARHVDVQASRRREVQEGARI